MCGRNREITGATDHTASGFTDHFSRKVEDIRADIAATPAIDVRDTATSSRSSFHPVKEAVVCHIIMSSRLKSCSLDQMPTFLIGKFVELLTLYVTEAIVNSPLSQG